MSNTNIDGHVAVGRDVAVGGNATVQGDMTVGHGLNVRGWLDAPNIKGANKGVFSTEAKLKAAYPTPHEGWYAGVIDSTDVVLYIVDGGEWTSTSAEYKGAYDAPGKADKVSGGTEDNFAALDAEGNLKDSGKSADDFVEKEQGKGLSENDFTDALKGKLDALPTNADLTVALGGKEATANKVTTLSNPTDTQYPSAKLVKDQLDTKATKIGGFTSGHFAGLDGIGNITDSGKSAGDFATAAQGTKADTVYAYLNDIEGYAATAQGAKTDAVNAKNDAVDAKTAAQAAQTAAQAAQTAAETAASNAQSAAGLAVGEAVRCEFTFGSGGKKALCDDANLQLMVVDGVGYTEPAIELEEAGSVMASFIFKDVTEIPGDAFKNITELKKVHIPSHVHSIGKGAFSGCSGITDIDCEAMTPPTVGTHAFNEVDILTVQPKVHGVAKSLYMPGGGNWGGFTKIDTY